MTHQIEINHYETLIVKTNKNKIKFEPNYNTSDTLGLLTILYLTLFQTRNLKNIFLQI